MFTKVKSEPVELFLATGSDAGRVRESTDHAGPQECSPVFCTGSKGDDGLSWDTIEAAEKDVAQVFADLDGPNATASSDSSDATSKPPATRPAEQRYVQLHCDAMNLQEEIDLALNDMDAPSEKINWAHVGSMAEVVNRLQAVVDFCNGNNV